METREFYARFIGCVSRIPENCGDRARPGFRRRARGSLLGRKKVNAKHRAEPNSELAERIDGGMEFNGHLPSTFGEEVGHAGTQADERLVRGIEAAKASTLAEVYTEWLR